jgi:hypothetical protein
VTDRSPAAVWPISAELVLALDDRLGTPADGYVNGTQTWLTEDGPSGATLEWRLHPVASYEPPRHVSHHDVWDAVVGALRAGAPADAISLGNGSRPLASLWEGLECFPAYGEDLEPAVLARAATEVLGVAPASAGLVDHERIGEAWERDRRTTSLVGMLLDELGQRP